MSHHKREDCRFCSSSKLTMFLDLGDQPPSNSFILPKDIHLEKKFPLKVYICEDCGLVQLLDVVSSKEIFDDYHYTSSSSKALVNHYQNLIDQMLKRFGLNESSLVGDLGCNDGIMLDRYGKRVEKRVGIEPSKIAKLAQEKGHVVINDFFTKQTANKIIQEHGHFDFFTATNVFAHIDDMKTVVESVRLAIGDKGVFMIETPYLIDMLEKHYFDTIYHEHLCYYSLTALESMFKKYELEIFDVEKIELGASGPAIRVFVQKSKGKEEISKEVQSMLDFEKEWGVKNPQKYQSFQLKVKKIVKHLRKTINDLKANNKTIGIYGAPAKGNTLLNTAKLGSEQFDVGIAEVGKQKWGKLTPGSHIPVISEEEFLREDPDYALLLTWNYLDFFLENSPYIKQGGKFIVPLPTLSIKPESVD